MLDYILLDKLRRHHSESYYHSLRVSHLCLLVANTLDLEHEMRIKAVRSGLLHDIGKIYVPLVILNKQGPLLPEEYDKVKEHVNRGIHLLKAYNYDADVLAAVSGHHERADHSGYPNGIVTKDELSKLVAVCDVFDALTEQRSYKKALNKEFVLDQMQIGKFGAFHQKYVDALKYIVTYRREEAVL